jgi:hypothetical protein
MTDEELEKLPKNTTVLGTVYKIFYTSEREDEKMKNADGYVEPYAKEIYINKDLYDDEYKSDHKLCAKLEELAKISLRHELVHAFLIESGLWSNTDWATNEEMTDWIARQFPKMQKVFEILGVAE